jgi:hypothetical protein
LLSKILNFVKSSSSHSTFSFTVFSYSSSNFLLNSIDSFNSAANFEAETDCSSNSSNFVEESGSVNFNKITAPKTIYVCTEKVIPYTQSYNHLCYSDSEYLLYFPTDIQITTASFIHLNYQIVFLQFRLISSAEKG